MERWLYNGESVFSPLMVKYLQRIRDSSVTSHILLALKFYQFPPLNIFPNHLPFLYTLAVSALLGALTIFHLSVCSIFPCASSFAYQVHPPTLSPDSFGDARLDISLLCSKSFTRSPTEWDFECSGSRHTASDGLSSGYMSPFFLILILHPFPVTW